MDIYMNYDDARKLEPKGLLESLQKKYPDRDLYSISVYWMEAPEYIAKARGVYGDVVVSWNKGGC